MKNNGLFSTLFIQKIANEIGLDDLAQGRMATLAHAWKTHEQKNASTIWKTFMNQALGYLQFVPGVSPISPGVYTLFEDFNYSNCIAILCLTDPDEDLDEKTVGRFWPAKLIVHLRRYKLNWGILTDGATWRLYSTKSSRPFEDFVELSLADALEAGEESEYALFERFFRKDSFVPEEESGETEESRRDEAAGVYKCRLDRDKEASEGILDKNVKRPLLYQVDEVLQYLCNGFIADTPKKGEEYTEAERKEIFESAVKLLYRCLFFFYAESRRLLPSEIEKAETYEKQSIRALCREAHRFYWGKRKDYDSYDLWQHLKGLVNALNDGDPEYGIMGYNGGLFDDEEEKFLGQHKLRNDFLSRALYLLAYVEPQNGSEEDEYEIPYVDLEVRHLGELYENILEYNVVIADAPFNRWMTKKGPVLRLASDGKPSQKARIVKQIKKGDVFFAQTALERKQTGSYYTPEPLVRFLNEKAVIDPLREKFDKDYRRRFDEFLEQARSGYDDSTRRGASRSALALIERFVNEELLNFKVCDPAMGSGHFLVDASNQMAGFVVELLAEIPSVNGSSAYVTSDPNYWRRRITRNCLYGVDLNPLAVNLARLSLWLNCFATSHKLTFIDHHLCSGNSLIGIRTFDQLRDIPQRKKDSKKKKKPQLTFNFDEIVTAFADAAKAVKSITEIPEDDTDRQKAIYNEASEKTQTTLVPLADLFTAYLMDGTITEEEYRDLFLRLAKGEDISNIVNAPLREIWSRFEEYATGHGFFHWALSFPDVFAEDGMRGFDATIGNPPWDILKPNSQEFFSAYDPDFRKYKKRDALKISKHIMENNVAIKHRWEDYCKSFAEQSNYVREPLAFKALGKGDINTYKLFLERFSAILKKGGCMGIIVPSGLYTDQGCLPLRKLFFENSQIKCLYCFENRWPTVFSAVDGRFKFVSFSTQKRDKTDSFKCAFMEHDPERLPAIDANALKISVEQVRRFSPDTLSVMEFNRQSDIEVTAKIYGNWPFLGENIKDSWNLIFEREIQDNSAIYLQVENETGRSLIEGKMIHQFDYEFGSPSFYFDERAYQALAKSDKYVFDCRQHHKNGARLSCSEYRLVCRRQAASTNERTFILAIIQPGDLCGDNLEVSKSFSPGTNRMLIERRDLLSLLGVLNSFVVDFIVRNKITTNLNKFYLYQLPIPRKPLCYGDSKLADAICARVSRLICVSESFADLWDSVFDLRWSVLEFWYNDPTSLYRYGPQHEQEIRQRLAKEVDRFTKNWASHCGVYNRTPDRRDTGDRAQLRAEIDAYVAHLYGLSRDDFAYILNTFPVLKKKEEQAFGEYMSKRKCLEEYDRIATME